MSKLPEDLKKARLELFKIEALLIPFNAMQVSPMSDEQQIRHELFRIRTALDETIARAEKMGVDYTTGPSFHHIEP